MSLKWIDVDCYDCFAVLMTYLKYEHWITLVYPNFLRHSVVCGWPHWNGMSVACPTGLVVWNRFWIRASQGSCLTTSLSPLSSPPWNSFMIGVRPIDDPFVTVYFDRWHRHHLVQALCDSMRELTVGVLSGWAKLNLFFDSKWWQKDYQLPSTAINFHQLPSTSKFKIMSESGNLVCQGAAQRDLPQLEAWGQSENRAAFSSPKSLAHWYELK